MTATEILEVALALVLIGAGIWMYRKSGREDSRRGSQGAVILFAIAALLLIHGLGLMEYRPSRSEIGAAQSR